jgi:hypothetical protein
MTNALFLFPRVFTLCCSEAGTTYSVPSSSVPARLGETWRLITFKKYLNIFPVVKDVQMDMQNTPKQHLHAVDGITPLFIRK